MVIVNYSMPIWASLMAWLILGERLSVRAGIGLALCVGGLTTLVYPVAGVHSATGLLLALGCALCWAAGTIYMKWAKIPGDLITITAWQIAIGAVVFAAGLLIFQAVPAPESVSLKGVLAVLFTGLIGIGLAYVLWFAIIERLPTATASLGSLATPVVGVASSMLMLGERPTTADMIGFGLIFAAAVCVLVPGRPPTPSPEADCEGAATWQPLPLRPRCHFAHDIRPGWHRPSRLARRAHLFPKAGGHRAFHRLLPDGWHVGEEVVAGQCFDRVDTDDVLLQVGKLLLQGHVSRDLVVGVGKKNCNSIDETVRSLVQHHLVEMRGDGDLVGRPNALGIARRVAGAIPVGIEDRAGDNNDCSLFGRPSAYCRFRCLPNALIELIMLRHHVGQNEGIDHHGFAAVHVGARHEVAAVKDRLDIVGQYRPGRRVKALVFAEALFRVAGTTSPAFST